MKLKLIAIMVLAFSIEAMASGEVIVCRNSAGAITSTELLDYYEGRVNRNIPHIYEASISNEEYFTKLRNKAEAVYDYNWSWKEELLKMALKLSDAITTYRSTGKTNFKGFIFTSEQLTISSDESMVTPPKGCEIDQALTVQKPAMPGDPEIIVQKELIKHLSDDHIRGLITSAVLKKYALKEYDMRYLHQKITAISINDLNFRYIFNVFKKHLTKIDSFDVNLMSELPTGELFYDKSYIINDNGQKNREKTLLYGEFATHWHLYAVGKHWHTTTASPKDWIITFKYEDGTIEEFRPNGPTCALKLKHGKIKVNLFIPAQIVRPRFGIFEQSLKYMRLTVAEKTVFTQVEVGLRSVNLTKTLTIELDQQNNWTAVEE